MRKLKASGTGVLHKSGEDYLEAVLILSQRKSAVRSVDVAEFLQYSRPSVCNAVASLCQFGYLVMDPEHSLHLTESGRAIAETIYERHRLITRLLELSGVDPKRAEADACKLEHDISAETFEQIKKVMKTHTKEDTGC